MTEQSPAQDERRLLIPGPVVTAVLPLLSDDVVIHEASSTDAEAQRDWEARLLALLCRGDHRDRAAELRDRGAEKRSPTSSHPYCWLDREWAGRDRDAAATDRSDLLDLMRERGMDRSGVPLAVVADATPVAR